MIKFQFFFKHFGALFFATELRDRRSQWRTHKNRLTLFQACSLRQSYPRAAHRRNLKFMY